MTRVVHVVLSLDVGGLERIVLDLARIGRRRGESPVIVTVDRPGQLAKVAEASGVPVVCLNADADDRPAACPRAEAVLTKLRPGVVHTHQIAAAKVVAPAARRLSIPVAHTEHGDAFARAAGPAARAKLRWVYTRAARDIDRFCCVTPEIAKAVARYGTVRSPEVVPNGVALPESENDCTGVRAELGIPAGAFVVGSVGRLNEVKRYDLLVRAVAEMRMSRSDVCLLLVGDGPELPRLTALVGELNLTPFVRFAGYRACPERYYPALDVFALTSRSEGFPVSLLEAWAAGKPAVVTAVGGLPGVVADGLNGLLVPPGDASAVAVALARLYNKVDVRRAMGAAGRATVEAHYTLDRVADRYAEIYRRIGAATPR